ncbi:tRNA maturase RNaseZ metal-dependent hydrolase [Staphylococcus phage vB_SsapH-Golestan-100]|nr:tRNA maturase RNaseZ metal-dependent hydrolase [Staphylococcus phage vB_SsapH-Golestan-100]
MFKLKSLGFGSAFNSQEYGNNSWYFIEDDKVFMIDCGSTVFNTFREKGLDKYKEVNIILTHMHTDHVGSLGTLIEWMYYAKDVKVNILIYNTLRRDLLDYLLISGIEESMFNLEVVPYGKQYIYKGNVEVIFEEVKHVPQVKTYSITLIKDNTDMIIYSGDTTEKFQSGNDSLFRHYTWFMDRFPELRLTGLYLDVSLNKSPVHANYYKNIMGTCDMLDEDLKRFNTEVVIMHLDDTVENYKKQLTRQDGYPLTIGGDV